MINLNLEDTTSHQEKLTVINPFYSDGLFHTY